MYYYSMGLSEVLAADRLSVIQTNNGEMGHLSGNVEFECKLSRGSWYISLWNIAILISVDE